MAKLGLELLGQFHLTRNGQPLSGSESNKARALLAYLVVEAARTHSREQLATLLWPDYNDERARVNLRQALHQLRHGLGEAVDQEEEAQSWLVISRQSVQFKPNQHCTVDVHEFTMLLDQVAHHAHQQLHTCKSCLARLQQAVSCYRGEFLANFGIDNSAPFEEWRRLKQEELHLRALEALQQLAAAYEASGNLELTHAYALRQLELEPWREEAHRQIMRSLAQSGQRNAAIVQYKACCKILEAEFGIEPDEVTRALYHQILQGSLPAAQATLVAEVPDSTAAVPQTVESGTHLPTALTPFVGRKQALDDLLQQVSDPHVRLLTLIGAGGMGKTRLALEVVRCLVSGKPPANQDQKCADNKSAPLAHPNHPFVDGIFFVELAHLRSTDEIVPAVSTAVGLRHQGGNPRQQLLHFLRDKALLLLLDNCEHLPHCSDLVVAILQAAAQVRILATSRARLQVQGEQLYPVLGMTYPTAATLTTATASSAITLFVQSAQRVQPTFILTEGNLAAVLRICQLVQGMPLGLELAATWADVLPLPTIAQEIEQNLDFLATDWRNTPERQRSLRAVFNWSWQMLSTEEQQSFRRLASFRGGFTRAAAQAVTGATLRTLLNLCHKSLLTPKPGEDRYEFHELLRQFAAEVLAAQPSEQAIIAAKHSDFYLNFVIERSERLSRDDSRLAASEIFTELDNIRQAWLWAVEQVDHLALGKSCLALAKFYDQVGLMTERNQLFGQAIVALQKSPPTDIHTDLSSPSAQPTYHVVLSKLCALQAGGLIVCGKFDEAVAFAEKAISLGAAHGGTEGEGFGSLALGQIHYRKDLIRVAEEHLLRALHLAQHYRPPLTSTSLLQDVEFTAQVWLGGIAVERSEHQRAETLFLAALQSCRSLGNLRGEVHVQMNLADLAWRVADYSQARQLYEENLQLAQRTGDRLAESTCFMELGETVRLFGEYDRARTLLLQAERVFAESGSTLHHAFTTAALSRLHVYLGAFATARHWLDQLTVSQHAAHPPIMMEAAIPRALLAYHTGDLAAARAAGQAGLQLSLDSNQIRQSQLLVLLGHIESALQEATAATTYYNQAISLGEAISQPGAIVEARAGLAALALGQNELVQALALVEAILPYLATEKLAGVDEPFFTYLTCYRVLVATRDHRAWPLLARGYARLESYADQITDPTLRHTFLTKVPAHAALRQAHLLATAVENKRDNHQLLSYKGNGFYRQRERPMLQ